MEEGLTAELLRQDQSVGYGVLTGRCRWSRRSRQR